MRSATAWFVMVLIGIALSTVICHPAGATLVAQWDFEDGPGDATTPDTGAPPAFDGTINGTNISYVPGKVGNWALDFNATNNEYVGTGAVASALGVGGNNPKTVTSWAYTRAFNNAAPVELGFGSGSGGNDFSLRTRTGTDQWRAQFWSTPDFDLTIPGSANNWTHLALVHDGTEGRVYANGLLVARKASTLVTSDSQDLRIGSWHGYEYDGQVDDVRVYNEALGEAAIVALAGNQLIEGFEGGGASLPADWYVSSGMNSTRLRSNVSQSDQFALSTFDNDANDPAGTVRNVYNVHQDNVTSQSFGPLLRVNDETQSLTFLLQGGNFAFNENSQRNGGTGLALWDVQANDYVRDSGGNVRFTPRTGQGAFQPESISLAGLEGRMVMPVLVDRQTGGWGWTGVDTISAPLGAVTELDNLIHHHVYLEYGFDEPGDFMGWTGDTGSFRVGDTPGGLATRHINLKGTFTVGEGFLGSTTAAGGWDSPTGTLRSPEFTVAGDIIEFYVAGGNRDNLSFELWVDMDGTDSFTLQRTSRHQADATEFDYDFWSIRDLRGLDAYLQLVDNNPGTWGHIHVDGIRMVGFAVPEPSTLLLAGLGLVGLALGRRRRRRA